MTNMTTHSRQAGLAASLSGQHRSWRHAWAWPRLPPRMPSPPLAPPLAHGVVQRPRPRWLPARRQACLANCAMCNWGLAATGLLCYRVRRRTYGVLRLPRLSLTLCTWLSESGDVFCSDHTANHPGAPPSSVDTVLVRETPHRCLVAPTVVLTLGLCRRTAAWHTSACCEPQRQRCTSGES